MQIKPLLMAVRQVFKRSSGYQGFKCLLSTVLMLSIFLGQTLLAQPLQPFGYDEQGLILSLQGSNTVGANLAPHWAKHFLEAKGAKAVVIKPLANPNEYRIQGLNNTREVFINVQAHGSSTGFKGLKNTTADIALSSRPIKPNEAEQLKFLGNMRKPEAEHVVAIDGLAIVVHPRNHLTQVPVNTLAKVFAGDIKNWQALGGPNQPITLYARDEQSGTYDTFKSVVLAKRFKLAASALRFESNDELSRRVASDANGIGFVGLASVNTAKALAVSADESQPNALLPTVIYVATEDYPLSRRLYLYTAEHTKKPATKEFVAFAQSMAGQDVVETIGFVSQNPKGLAVAISEGPAQYQALSQFAKRLTVNFRFQPGQAELDNKALQDVQRIARYFTGMRGEPMNIQLVGFSNSESSPRRAKVLSRLRATAVKTALYRHKVTTESVIGFGDTFRVAATTGLGALKNERVEVWLYPQAQAAAIEKAHQDILARKRTTQGHSQVAIE